MQHLNESQRYTIYRMRKDKKTQSEIAVDSTSKVIKKRARRLEKKRLSPFFITLLVESTFHLP